MSKDYRMYTEFGNDAVDRVVRSARILKMSWPLVLSELDELARKEDFSEANDTVVREAVFAELGFVGSGQLFYA